jgi:hypothetical protein
MMAHFAVMLRQISFLLQVEDQKSPLPSAKTRLPCLTAKAATTLPLQIDPRPRVMMSHCGVCAALSPILFKVFAGGTWRTKFARTTASPRWVARSVRPSAKQILASFWVCAKWHKVALRNPNMRNGRGLPDDHHLYGGKP